MADDMGGVMEMISEVPDYKKQDTGGEPDWKSLAKQLIQAISLMDTQTDAAMSGEMSDAEAIAAIDQMTSRILWGKQSPENPNSSYQNENYSDSVAAGVVMEKPADLWGDGDGDELPGPSAPAPKEKGFKGAAKRAMGKPDEQDDMEEDDGE